MNPKDSPASLSDSDLALTFDAQGLIPVVVQDEWTGEIRMVAFASREAVRATLSTGLATFFSRSRGTLWQKGEESGNAIRVSRVLVDCDADCLVYSGQPSGPSCHTGAPSCFFRALNGPDGADGPDGRRGAGEVTLTDAGDSQQTLLARLESVLEARKASTGERSYTKSLYDKGVGAIAGKIREEAGELAQAVEGESDDRVVSEAADALYHVMVALRARAIPFRHVLRELARRLGTSGHKEKASRGAAR